MERTLEAAKRLPPKRRGYLLQKIAGGARAPIRSVNAITPNQKTDLSFDCTTLCPKHVMAGVLTGDRERKYPCSYCYVDTGRKGLFAKTACAIAADNTNRILRMRQPGVDKLNAGGGLRVFSSADYVDTPRCNQMINNLIRNAKKRGLKLKAITKRPKFVKRYAKDFDTINVSVDTIGEGMSWKQARSFASQYPNVVQIRAVAMNPRDMHKWAQKPPCRLANPREMCVDVITLYHGARKHYARKKIDPEWEKEITKRRREGEEINDEIDMEPMNLHKTEVQKMVEEAGDPTRTCCQGGKCATCQVKCRSDQCVERPIIDQSVDDDIAF